MAQLSLPLEDIVVIVLEEADCLVKVVIEVELGDPMEVMVGMDGFIMVDLDKAPDFLT